MNVLTKEQMEEIYRCNCDMVYRVCLLQLKHEQDALDAVSETFVRLFQKKPDFADTEHEKAWLIRTAINYCKDVQKSFWKRKRNVYDAAAEQDAAVGADTFRGQRSAAGDMETTSCTCGTFISALL